MCALTVLYVILDAGWDIVDRRRTVLSLSPTPFLFLPLSLPLTLPRTLPLTLPLTPDAGWDIVDRRGGDGGCGQVAAPPPGPECGPDCLICHFWPCLTCDFGP